MKPFKKSTKAPADFLTYTTERLFALRVALATLYRRKIRIRDIRAASSNPISPGVNQFETNLLHFIDSITDGGHFVIDPSGCQILYTPGVLLGSQGQCLTWRCDPNQNVAHYLEVLLFLAPFARTPTHIRLKGSTHASTLGDTTTVHHFQNVVVPLVKQMGIFAEAEQELTCRLILPGFPPDGQGEIEFYCPTLKKIKPFHLLRCSRIQRIRGLAYTHCLSPQYCNHMIDAARRVLNDYIPDVWIHAQKSSSPSNDKYFGISLVAESMTHYFLGVDLCQRAAELALKGPSHSSAYLGSDITTLLKDASSQIQIQPNRPPANATHHEDSEALPAEKTSTDEPVEYQLGQLCAYKLLDEIASEGLIDSRYQHIPLVFMSLAEDSRLSEVRKPRCGSDSRCIQMLIQPLTSVSVDVLRHVYDMCGVKFTLTEAKQTPKLYVAKCLGIGLQNMERRAM